MQTFFDAIEPIAAQQSHPVIFLCGLGGTGKTTFAHKVQEKHLSVVIETDWYLTYATEERKERIAKALASGDPAAIEREENPLHWYDWDRFMDDVKSLKRKGKLRIRNAWNQTTGKKDVDINVSFKGEKEWIICEGIYLLHPPLIDLADFVVLLEGDKGLARKRSQERDTHRSSAEYLAYKAELVENYDLPYFEKYRENADLVLKITETAPSHKQEWETVIDFTEGGKKEGIPAQDLLKTLKKLRRNT